MKYNDISKDWKQYNKRAGEPPRRKLTNIDMIVVHCTDDEDLVGEDVYSIINYHTNPNHVCATGCWTICYHYYIESVNGIPMLWKTVDEEIRTFHAGWWNARSIGVVIDKKANDIIEDNKYEMLIELLADLCAQFGLHPNIAIAGHRNLLWTGWKFDEKKGIIRQNKTCPGQLAGTITDLQNDVARVLKDRGFVIPEIVDTGFLYHGEIYHTPESFEILSQYNKIWKMPPSGLFSTLRGNNG